LFYIVAGNLLMEIEMSFRLLWRRWFFYVVKESIIGFQQPKNVLSCSLNPKQQNIPEGKISNYQNDRRSVLAFWFWYKRT
jgi:hypothetical protein